MKTKVTVLAVLLMICSLIAVPVSAAPTDMKCCGAKTQCEQKEKQGCSAEKKKCDGEKKECGSEKKECSGEKKEQCQDKEKASAKG